MNFVKLYRSSNGYSVVLDDCYSIRLHGCCCCCFFFLLFLFVYGLKFSHWYVGYAIRDIGFSLPSLSPVLLGLSF